MRFSSQLAIVLPMEQSGRLVLNQRKIFYPVTKMDNVSAEKMSLVKTAASVHQNFGMSLLERVAKDAFVIRLDQKMNIVA